MFFSWLVKSKHFKQRNNLSGQIMPFLIVIIAIFLGAAFTTLQIGKDAISLTCRDNAADSCSLAAASMWARSLNELMVNNDTIKNTYESYQIDLKKQIVNEKKSFDLARAHLKKAVDYIDQASLGTCVPSGNCVTWPDVETASGKLKLASDEATEAKNDFTTASNYASHMEIFTDLMQEDQKLAYQEMRGIMEQNYVDAKLTGLDYGFKNNCVYDGLSEGQRADYDADFEGSFPDLEDELNKNDPVLGDKWNDAEAEWVDGNGYTQKAIGKVELPEIDSYNLEVTKKNTPCPFKPNLSMFNNPSDPLNLNLIKYGAIFPEEDRDASFAGRTTLERLSSIMENAATILKTASEKLHSLKLSANDYSKASYCATPSSESDGTTAATNYNNLRTDAKTQIDNVNNLKLQEIVSFTNASGLKAYLDGAFLDALKGPQEGLSSRRIFNSKTFDDTGDLIIIGIDSVKFKEPRCIKCEMTLGGNTSKSSSAYNGGSMKPVDIQTTDSIYEPRITNQKPCPAEPPVRGGAGSVDPDVDDGGCAVSGDPF